MVNYLFTTEPSKPSLLFRLMIINTLKNDFFPCSILERILVLNNCKNSPNSMLLNFLIVNCEDAMATCATNKIMKQVQFPQICVKFNCVAEAILNSAVIIILNLKMYYQSVLCNTIII